MMYVQVPFNEILRILDFIYARCFVSDKECFIFIHIFLEISVFLFFLQI